MSASSCSRSRRSGPISPSPSSSSCGTRTCRRRRSGTRRGSRGPGRRSRILLMAGHFAVPFLYLMGRAVKRRGSTLAIGGAWLLAHALRGPLLAGHADAASRRVPSVGSGRRGVRDRRRVLRGGGELADAAAGARATPRPAGSPNRWPSRTSEAGDSHGAGCTKRGRCRVCPSTVRAKSTSPRIGARGRRRVCASELAMTKESSMRGTGNRLWLAAGLVAVSIWPGVAVRRLDHHRNHHLRRESPHLKPLAMDADPACAKKHSAPVPSEMLVLGSGNTMGTSWSGSRRGSRPGRPIPRPRLQ